MSLTGQPLRWRALIAPIYVTGAVGFCHSLQLAAAAKTVYALMHDELWVWPSFVGTNISLHLHDRNVSLQSLSERPRVLRVASLLSDSECDHIIELANPLMIRSKVRPVHPCDASVVTHGGAAPAASTSSHTGEQPTSAATGDGGRGSGERRRSEPITHIVTGTKPPNCVGATSCTRSWRMQRVALTGMAVAR